MPADIPPPSEADLSIDLVYGYETYAFARKHGLTDLTDEGMDRVMGFIRRCHAVEAENERLRGLRDRAEVAFRELEAAERRLDRLAEAVKENDSLRAELADAVKALVSFNDDNCDWYYDNIRPGDWVRGWVLKEDLRRAAAIVAKHKQQPDSDESDKAVDEIMRRFGVR